MSKGKIRLTVEPRKGKKKENLPAKEGPFQSSGARRGPFAEWKRVTARGAETCPIKPKAREEA